MNKKGNTPTHKAFYEYYWWGTNKKDIFIQKLGLAMGRRLA